MGQPASTRAIGGSGTRGVAGLLVALSATMLTIAVFALAGMSAAAAFAVARGSQITHAHIAEHFACSDPADAHKRCYFSTPSDDVRCLWTPNPNRVTCELLSTRRAYRLGPTGPAKAVRVELTRRGETLPVNQMIVFPDELSCQDTKVAMTCDQDEASGEFKLSSHG
jgi:hypothetical protein